MNKQLLLNGLVGSVLTLGVITVASAGDLPWRYDADTDTVIYSFSGVDHNYGEADYPVKQQAGDLPWHYDAATDTVIYAFSRADNRTYREADYPVKQAGDLPWRYDEATDRVIYAFSGPDSGSVGQSEGTTKRIAMDGNLP
jgi:hypothetical protein